MAYKAKSEATPKARNAQSSEREREGERGEIERERRKRERASVRTFLNASD